MVLAGSGSGFHWIRVLPNPGALAPYTTAGSNPQSPARQGLVRGIGGLSLVFVFELNLNRGFARKPGFFGKFDMSAKNYLLRYLCAEDAVFCAGFLVSCDGV